MFSKTSSEDISTYYLNSPWLPVHSCIPPFRPRIHTATLILTDYHQFTASMWTPEQSQAVIAEAKSIVGPQLKTLSLPPGLQVERGPDAVVDYIKEKLPGLIEG